jgi:predicted nucleic-acid-binding Zn-ribbon protein
MEHPTRRLDDEETGEFDSDQEPDPCPKCGNARIWISLAQPIVREFTKPGINYKGLSITSESHRHKYASCRALLCSECGYTELYAQNPKILL